MSDTAPLSPISDMLNISVLPTKGRHIKLHPDNSALKALAQILSVTSIADLSAQVLVKKWHKDGIRISGEAKAEVTQPCIVTLEPVVQVLETQIDAVFVPEGSKLARPRQAGESGDYLVDAEGPDAPEPFTPPFIDVGACVHEFIALAIDPYPRARDAQDTDTQILSQRADAPADEKVNPFAVLQTLKPAKGAKT